MKRMMKKKKGFTLIELLVVLLILGVLVGLGVPRYMEAQKVARFNTFAANVRSIAEALDNYVAIQQATATGMVEYPATLKELKDAGLVSQDFINPYTKSSMLADPEEDPNTGIKYTKTLEGYVIYIKQLDVDDVNGNGDNTSETLYDVNPSMFPTTATPSNP